MSSQKGLGSTFAFYIKSRKAQGPPPDSSLDAAITEPDAPSLLKATVAEATKLQYSTKSDPETSSSARMVSSNVQLARSFPPDSKVPPPLDILIVEDNLVNQKVCLLYTSPSPRDS